MCIVYQCAVLSVCVAFPTFISSLCDLSRWWRNSPWTCWWAPKFWKSTKADWFSAARLLVFFFSFSRFLGNESSNDDSDCGFGLLASWRHHFDHFMSPPPESGRQKAIRKTDTWELDEIRPRHNNKMRPKSWNKGNTREVYNIRKFGLLRGNL